MPRPVVYRQVAERVRAAVAQYRDGWEIPSVRALAGRFDVSRNTVLRGLAVLAEEGAIARQGTGRRYVRRRSQTASVYYKPYPAVAITSAGPIRIAHSGYLGVLTNGFVDGLSARLPVGIFRARKGYYVKPVPGGAALGPPEMRYSCVAFVSGGPSALLAELVASGAIIITLDCLCDIEGVDSMAIDCEQEADVVIEYLAGLGHRRIGLLEVRYQQLSSGGRGDGRDPDAMRFERAMLHAKQRLGLNVSADYHVVSQADPEMADSGVWLAVERLWQIRPPPTALICFDDGTADAALTAIGDRRLRCPADVSIVTRGMVKTKEPTFTTLASDPRRMGAAAASHMLTRLTEADAKATHLLFPSALTVGTTTGPAPK